MSGISPGVTDFAQRVLVGPGLRGIQNSFATVTEAISYINALSVPDSPALDRKFVIDLEAGDFHEAGLIIPDWVWIEGKGMALTRIIQDSGDGNFDFLIQMGLSGINNIGFLSYVVEGACNVWNRNKAAVYALTKEAYSISGGETLFVSRGAGSPITVTFQAGDTSASACASRINGTVGVAAAGVIARSFLGYLIVDSNGPAPTEVHIGASGTANTIFGWPVGGVDGEVPSGIDALKEFNNVRMVLMGSPPDGGSDCFVDDDLSQMLVTFHQNLNIRNFQSGGTGVRYQGSVVEYAFCDIWSDGAAFYCMENAITPSTNNWLSLIQCKLQDSRPMSVGGDCIQFEDGPAGATGYQVYMYGTHYNRQSITDNSTNTSYIFDMISPFQREFLVSEAISQSSLATWTTKLDARIGSASKGSWKASISFEARVTANLPPRDCLIRCVVLGVPEQEMIITSSTFQTISFEISWDILSDTSDSSGPVLEFASTVVGRSVEIRRARASVWRTG